ncbi:uncharacterized protein Dwil_GK20449 [Drosophila willistoni]|uniref:Cell cycle checkpoint control protein n=1 Tax=Drosophila willistoni TaxID=7260 RepID=B4N4U8_DROWI|nr:cell cycle checkpoint control protein RAD9A [Drosophila willistoni]EDW79387.1 uncharacterized protein Dwil_GK20449 [Drosophila willistoni]
MKCTLEGNNAKVIAKAIQSLSKVGKELYIEADQQGLQLRAINATHSAVGSISFQRCMFETYNLPSSQYCYCKISMKVCLATFRNMKQVEHCEMSIVENHTKLQVKLRCKLETMKQALIAIIDDQNINAAVSKEASPNVIRGDFKLFMEISNNFNTNEEELTLEVDSNSLAAKNYIEGARVSDRFMRSQLKLKSSEFDQYLVTKNTVITFCIREFRAFLLFAETLNAPLNLEFNEAGDPFLLKINKHQEIECILIMSTLSPDDVSFSEDNCQRELTVDETPDSQQVVSKKRKNSQPIEANAPEKRRVEPDDSLMESNSSLSNSLFQFRPSEPPSVEAVRQLADVDTLMVIPDEADEEALMLAAADAAMATQMPKTNPNPSVPSSTEVCFYNTEDTTIVDQQQHLEEEEDDEEESIPQSPEREQRKIRTIFSRCFQSTYVPREPSPNSQVYVPNSDTED